MIGLKNRIISFRASSLIGVILILFSISTCQRFEPESLIVITTDNIEALADRNYKLTGTFINLGEEEITQHGFCWSEQRNPTTTGQTTQLEKRSTEGSFSSIIADLTATRTYYVRSYAISVAGTTYGDEESFTTSPPTLPILTTTSHSNITESSAQSGGNITNDGGDPVSVRGVCWSTSQSPTVSDYKTTDGSGEGSFTSILSGLTCETTYYFRAYATNSAGTAYGSQLNFTTSACPTADPPIVTTSSVTGATETTAQGGGNVTSDGGAPITARGVCWNTTGSPTTLDPKTTDAGTTGSYTSSITGLTCGNTYYVRAYATNSSGTSYGDQVQFTTSVCTTDPPTVSTSSVTNPTETTAQGGGIVTSDGGAAITARGICWSTSLNPTTSNYKTTESGTTGSYTSSITGLTCGTTYYVRAYAINSAGTTYGNQVQFTTTTCPVANPPAVTTATVTGASATTAQGGGNVTDDGGATITARGVCWNTTGNPTISSPKTTDAGTTGSYTSSLTGLSPFTTYYVRAYATNSAGTSYGSEVTIKTLWDNSITINDFDGNQYNTVQIGDQVWMAEGLMATHYADGTAIPLVTSSSTWSGLGSTGKAYCWYNNSTSWGPIYGALYTWAAAMNGAGSSDANPSGVQGVCPDGWHLPSDTEWKQLEMNLGMTQSAANDEGYRGTDEGGKLKETGLTNWSSPNAGATNVSGFTARPAGIRANDGAYIDLGNTIGLWTTTEYSSTVAWDRSLTFDVATVWRFRYLKNNGFSVRCVKDN